MQAYIIIPAYQPDEMLIHLVKEMADSAYNVLVVDDGSGPSYSTIFDQVRPYSLLLSHTTNKGKGAAIKTALSHLLITDSAFDFVAIMDADGQHHPSDVMNVLSYATQHADGLTLGVRQIGNKMPLRSRFGNRMTQLLFRAVSGVWVSDTQTGLRAFSRELCPNMLTILGDRYEYEMNVLMEYAKHKLPIYETPIETLYEKGNKSSHFRIVQDSLRIYSNLLQFIGSSFLSFCLDYVLYVAFCYMLGGSSYSVLLVNTLARVASGLFNYEMNCRFVFHQTHCKKTFLQYVTLAAVLLVCNNVLLQGYLLIGAGPWFGKLLAEGTLFVGSFLVQQCLIFKNR